MRSFLFEVAEKVHQAHADLDKLTFVFPNRRAILYFRKHLTEIIEKPVFSPRFTTIEDFIGDFSDYEVPDKLELVHRLYKAYYETLPQQKERETFDKFYFWGDMLLRDFDEVDKYMVNAGQLFLDLSNQKELDSGFEFLTEEQLQFLRDFWGNFDDHLTSNKQKFLHVWRLLPEVYTRFKQQLHDNGLAYQGMVHREVAERIVDVVQSSGNRKIVFAGFNALTTAEEKIISAFVARGLAEVYWDIDHYYVNNNTQEAGRFFRQYQEHPTLGKTFPADIPSNFNTEKTVKIVGAAQNIGQTKIMAQFLDDQLKKNKFSPEETLIVMPDEKLLLPVLHGISGSVEKLNVTMGFPLSSAPVFNLIEFLAELQAGRKDGSFNHRNVLSVIGHPYVLGVDPVHANNRRKEIIEKNKIAISPDELIAGPELWRTIFVIVKAGGLLPYLRDVVTALGTQTSLTVLDKEFAFHFLKLINRFDEVTRGSEESPAESDPEKQFQSELKSFLRLFRQLVRSQKIPFSGEPLKGLQVMGVLETRNLDYKNVFIISLNEGSLPASGNKASYIPFNIRKAYALPTAEHQDAFYAYLFYRVLQRAENVFLFYNTETDVLGQGEMSRYLQQLVFESGWTPSHQVLHNPIQPHAIQPIEIVKDETVLKNLAKLNEGNYRFKGISPSALNTYIECQLQFYFKHIAKIREANEVEEDLDARWLGNILHDVMELFYRGIGERKKSNLIEADDLKNYEAVTDKLIDDVFIRNYSLDPRKKVIYAGQRLVVHEVVKGFIARIIRYDHEYAPFSIEGLEHQGLLYYVPISHGPGQAVIGGKIDRLDKKGNTVRVIDYKTGRDKLEFDTIESLFSREGARNKAAFQILLYALLYHDNNPGNIRIKPGLINRLNLFEEEFKFGLVMNRSQLDDAVPLLGTLKENLKTLLEELFNPAETFKQTKNVDNCKFCAYQRICYRKS